MHGMKRLECDKAVVEALYRISSLPAKTDDPQEALEDVIDEVMQVLRGESASINFLNPDSQLLEIEVLRGLPEHSKQLQLSLGQGVTGWVALHGRPLLVPDVSKDPRYVPVKDTIRSEIAAPMLSKGTVIGVVNVDCDQLDGFSEEDLELLTLLTDEATSVLTRIWMTNQLRGKAQQLQALIGTSRNLVAQLEIGDLMRTIPREGQSLMSCRICALFLYDSHKKLLTLAAMEGARRTGDYFESLRLEESALGTAVRRRRQVEVIDLKRTEEHHFVEVVQEEKLVSMLTSPLIVEDEVIGVLCAYTDYRHRFSNDEKNLFSALCGMSALAIQNARLYQRIFESEETLRKNERLTTLGLLTAEIAHEIRNPLTVIKLLLGSLDLDFEESDVRKKDSEIIAEKLDQMEGIVTRVLSFGKTNEGIHSRWNLNSLVEDTLHLVRLKLQQGGVQLCYRPPERPIRVDASKGQLQQALLNLIINATQAMPDGGEIEISIKEETRDDIEVAAVDLKDSGCGIPNDIQDRIFDSFLTGHATGTGLGLNIVKRILRSHNGDVEVLSTSPSGTTMRIWIPIAMRAS